MRAARVHKPGPPDVIVVEDIDVFPVTCAR